MSARFPPAQQRAQQRGTTRPSQGRVLPKWKPQFCVVPLPLFMLGLASSLRKNLHWQSLPSDIQQTSGSHTKFSPSEAIGSLSSIGTSRPQCIFSSSLIWRPLLHPPTHDSDLKLLYLVILIVSLLFLKEMKKYMLRSEGSHPKWAWPKPCKSNFTVKSSLQGPLFHRAEVPCVLYTGTSGTVLVYSSIEQRFIGRLLCCAFTPVHH